MNLILLFVSIISITVACFSLLLAYFSFIHAKKSIEELHKVREKIGREFDRARTISQDTQELIERIAKLFDASEKAGLEMVYPNRNEALGEFRHFLEEESKEVAIVGSSLLGLSLFITGFEDVVREQPGKFKFILTHPEYSQAREGPEGRDNGVIKGEILESIHKLINWGVSVEAIQLYKGSPTVFMIAASDHMLLNPYPYGTEAYRCFCIQVSSRGSIFPQYYEKHYKAICDSEWVEKCSDFLERSKS